METLAHSRTLDTRHSSPIFLSAWEQGYIDLAQLKKERRFYTSLESVFYLDCGSLTKILEGGLLLVMKTLEGG